MAMATLFSPNTGLNTQRGFENEIHPAEYGLNPTSGSSNSLLQTSTNIFVFANGGVVGMIQSFSVSEARTINKLQSIGWEGVVQAVPSNTNGGQLSVSRLALYESSLWNSLGLTVDGVPYSPLGSKVFMGNSTDPNNWDQSTATNAPNGQQVSGRLIFKTLKDQRVPFEIQVKTTRVGDGTDWFIERYIDCWLSSYSKSYTVQSITVAEQATIQYADVY